MNVTRLKQAIAIIEAVPDEQLNLKTWQRSYNGVDYISANAQATCGTIACAAGWLALHPEMHAQRLSAGNGGLPVYQNEDGLYSTQFRALARFFDLSVYEANRLFEPRTGFECSDPSQSLYTDKEIWLKRANRFLEAAQNEC